MGVESPLQLAGFGIKAASAEANTYQRLMSVQDESSEGR